MFISLAKLVWLSSQLVSVINNADGKWIVLLIEAECDDVDCDKGPSTGVKCDYPQALL